MSKPSFENIDRWFFEYAEGNLSPAQVQEFENFLAQHPELQGELELWEDARLSQDEHDSFAVAALKKPVVPVGPILSYAGIAIVGILIGFGISQYFAPDSIYAKEQLNLSAIEIDATPVFGDKILRTGTGNNTAVASSFAQASTQYIGQATKESQLLSANTSTDHLNKEETSFNSASSSTPLSQLDQNHNNQLMAENVSVNAADLPKIKAFLNDNTVQMEGDLAEVSDKKTADMSNAFKRKMRSAFRKIKRMADQPIALKNTKDQYFHTPMMTGFAPNFGMVGSARGNRLQLTSRNQWVGHENQQLQNAISWDSYVYALRGGLGVDVSYNQYQKDALKNFSAALTYSPKFSINKNVSLEPALRFKMGMIDLNSQSSIIGSNIEMNRSNITPLFVDGGDPIGSSLWYRDVGAGIMLNTKWFYAGANVDNIGRHYDNFYSTDLNAGHRAKTHFTGIIGTEYESVTKDMRLSGYALYQKLGDLNELWGGVNAQFQWVQAGVAASSELGLSASAGVVFDNFSVHYNIDNTQSRLKQEKLLSHQITMRILMKPSRYAAKFLNM